ncbi:MotB family protein [Aquamicrobium sp. LC103]|uniref:MotB family protein n=1 Tax=Aquamicrobium sp. LC103 TaxID=1120658 RepID=UPI00063EA059|nr:MotB family protein [Aquamicrobium sp. LC103]TKT77493.1 MotB family protein [Aquamicrobium sp. LC103]
MSAFDAGDSRKEIIIVKRRRAEEDEGHHGSAWKIAFADFMTAMMCFFLVMWLISAANEQAKASIAAYFNPMTLVDRTPPSAKGIDDPGETRGQESPASQTEQSEEEPEKRMHDRAGPGQHANSINTADTRQTSDEHLFSDPYAVLAEIAAQTATLQNVSSKGDGGMQTSGPATGAEGGESYRDPFAPDFWSREIGNPEEPEVFEERVEAPAGETPAEAVADTAAEIPAEAPAPTEIARLEAPKPTPAETGTTTERPADATTRMAEEIRGEIATAFGADNRLNQTISVVPQRDGVLISVTDELNYGMFEIGSAVPQRELVLAMERISRALGGQPGRIVIKGHTDGRPFRGANYDNWRLSTARAHAAYYMLVRGGLEETRVREVAGHADRELKVPANPLADANRRIEILLETGN